MAHSTLRQAFDRLLPDGQPLEPFVTKRRNEGVSWRRIAAELYEATGVFVTHEALRRWFPSEPDEAVS